MKKTILTYGTFDLFHIGHLKLLQRLKSLGDELIVAVSTDQFNDIKGKKTIIPYEQRAEIVKHITFVDMVIPENDWEQKITDIKKHNVDVFAMGHDWDGKFDFLKEYCEVIYLNRTEGISSTQLKNTLKSFSVSKDEVIKAFDILEQLKEVLVQH
jgi:glycerol-3-phosphate cytidylyltransferase